jgi:hypothetical protein
MPSWCGSARKRARGCVAVSSAGVIAGLIWAAAPLQAKDLTPAQSVAERFPATWNPSAPAKRTASAVQAQEDAANLFSPTPTYGLASAESRPATPSGLMAYADADRSTVVTKTVRVQAPVEAPVERVSAPAERVAALVPAPKAKPPAKPTNHILNDGQIASIKARLRLTPQQEYYWPGVEQALRGIAYKMNKGASHGKLAAIDPNSAEVQQLKSAAVPLIMSFNDEQKNEVRQLAYVMGLEKLAQAF